MRRLLVSIGLVMATFGLAAATHPGSASFYDLVGFTADGKSVYFKKVNDSVMQREEWLAVWDGITGKQKTSQPVLRNCSPTSEKWDPSATCEPEGTPQIDEKSGKRSIAKIHATHGAPSADTILALKDKIADDKYLKAATSTGHTQVFTGKNVEVKATTKYEGKALPDVSDGLPKTAFFSLEVTVTAGAEAWTTKSRVYGEPVEDEDNGNIIRWSGLYVRALALAPDRHAVALVFAGKPFVIQRPKAAVPAKKP